MGNPLDHKGGHTVETDLNKNIKDRLLALASHSPTLGIVIVWLLKYFKSPIVAAGLAVGAGVWELLVLFWKGLGIPVWHEVWEQGDFKKIYRQWPCRLGEGNPFKPFFQFPLSL